MQINPFDILKNASKIQEQMKDIQERLEVITATGSSGGGLVVVYLNGKQEVTDVRIAPEAMEDVDMLQDLIVAAFSDGMAKIKEAINHEIGAMASGLNLSGFSGAV